MNKFLAQVVFISFCLTKSFAFQSESSEVKQKQEIYKPDILSVHPFGVFFNRLQGNFRHSPTKNINIRIHYNSGNVWGTPITTYVPNDGEIRDKVRQHEWHQAQYFFDEESLDTESFYLEIDGVIKTLKIEGRFPINDYSEINIGVRSFMLTSGKMPFSILTSDDFIETFHKKIAGGDDPFDRGVFGLNKASIKYTDRNGETMTLNKNDFIFSGIETTYYRYIKKWATVSFTPNYGILLGTNLSKYNSSLDIGLSVNALKTYRLNEKSVINVGVHIGVLRKGVVNFKNDNLLFGNNNYLGNFESAIEYSFTTSSNRTHSVGIDYYLQSSLNKREELEYIIPIRHPDAHKSWGHGVTNLYKTNNYWTLFYAFGKKVIKTLYLQQDLQVNNNPDIQTGISISFNLN
jgi:hypothetical protein